MGFETVVLSVVKDTVRHAQAEFTNGTMFVSNIDASEAVQIMNSVRGYIYADTIISKVGSDFAFDFI